MPREAVAETFLTIQGITVPKLGLGTWQITGRDCVEAVADALAIGYRHIDTARAYENEAEVGRALAASEVGRENVWLATKVWRDDFAADALRAACEDSLRALRTDYVDLLLLHWPVPEVPLAETLGAMNALRDEGKARHLGLSNFTTAQVADALELAPILTNQVEFHAYLAQPAVLAQARERELMVTAYSPFAHGELLDDPVLEEVAQTHGKTPGQIALRWLLDQPHVATIPKASSHQRRVENFDVFDVELNDEERGVLAELQRGRRTADPPWAPDWD